MKKILSAVLTATLILLLTACSNSNEFSDGETLSKEYTRNTDASVTYNYADGAETPPANYNAYASEISDLELRLYRNLYAQSKGTAFSATDAVSQLALFANAASGSTRNEYLTAFGSELPLDTINTCTSYLVSRLKAVSGAETEEYNELKGEKQKTSSKDDYVKLYNNVFINDSSDIKTSFLQTNADFFGSDIFRFSFDGENALDKVSSKLGSGVLTELDKNGHLVSVSSSSVADKWLEPYTKEDIQTGTFNATYGAVDKTFMKSNEHLLKSNKATAVLKYTKSNPLVFLAILPNEDISIDDYVQKLDYTELSKLLESFSIKNYATAYIPEFTINSEDKATSLKAVAEKSGLKTTFTEESDYKNLSHSGDIYPDDIMQKLPSITVNAYGINKTEKSTGVSFADEHIQKIEYSKTELKLDRPFVYMLLENENYIPLYIGTVE